MMAYPFGYTIFCDDIRDEVGGKVSFIGTYRAELRVHGEFPAILPKFAIHFTFVERADRRPDKLVVEVFFPGDPDDRPSMRGPIQVGDKEAGLNLPPVKKRNPEELFKYEGRLILAPFVIQSEGLIKVRIRVKNTEIKCGALRVLKADSPSIEPGPVPVRDTFKSQ